MRENKMKYIKFKKILFITVALQIFAFSAHSLDLEELRSSELRLQTILDNSKKHQAVSGELESLNNKISEVLRNYETLTGERATKLEELTNKRLQCEEVKSSLQDWASRSASDSLGTVVPLADASSNMGEVFKSSEDLSPQNIESILHYLEYGVNNRLAIAEIRLREAYISENQKLKDLQADFSVQARNYAETFNQSRPALNESSRCNVDKMMDIKISDEKTLGQMFDVGVVTSKWGKLPLSRFLEIFFAADTDAKAGLVRLNTLKQKYSNFNSSRRRNESLSEAVKHYMELHELEDNDIRWPITEIVKGPLRDNDRAEYILSLYEDAYQVFSDTVMACDTKSNQLNEISQQHSQYEENLNRAWRNGTRDPELHDALAPYREHRAKISQQQSTLNSQITTLKEYQAGLQSCNQEQVTIEENSGELNSQVTQARLHARGLSYTKTHYQRIIKKLKNDAQLVLSAKQKLIESLGTPQAAQSGLEVLAYTHAMETGKPINQLTSRLDSMSVGFSKNLISLKEFYETNIEQKIWDGKETVYNKASTNLFSPITENKLQCYSGSLQWAYNSTKFFSNEMDQIFMIFTDGHILPGYLEKQNDQSIFVGIEATARGPAILEYGLPEQVSGKVRVAKLSDFLIVEALKYDIENLKKVLDSTIKNLEPYGFKAENLLPYEDIEDLFASFGALNGTPFGFGTASLPDEDAERPYIEREERGPVFTGGGVSKEALFEGQGGAPGGLYVPGSTQGIASPDMSYSNFYQFLESKGLGKLIDYISEVNNHGHVHFDTSNYLEEINQISLLNFCNLKETTSNLHSRSFLDKNLTFRHSSKYTLDCNSKLLYYYLPHYGEDLAWAFGFGYNSYRNILNQLKHTNINELALSWDEVKINDENQMCLSSDSYADFQQLVNQLKEELSKTLGISIEVINVLKDSDLKIDCIKKGTVRNSFNIYNFG